MEVQEILKLLQFNRGFFPRGPLKQAILNREQIIPELLKIVEQSTVNVEEIDSSYFAHIYAMYLLAQFREKLAYPQIVDFFSIPGEITLDLTGDVVTEDLCRILASVSCGDTSLMTKLVENETINEYVRGAALKGLLTLAACGDKFREEIMFYYQSLFRGKLRREFSQVWNALVSSAIFLYPEEVYEDIKLACAEGLVEPFHVSIEEVDERLALGKEEMLERLKRSRYRLIEDTIDELEGWACFRATEKNKTGRNETCPCGSGIKYKKCCAG